MKLILIFTLSCFISVISFSQVMHSGTNITITRGTTLYVEGNLNIDAGEMNLNDGATLIMGNNQTLSVNNGGQLNIMGSDDFPAILTSTGYFNFEVNQGGTIAGNYALIEKTGIKGLFVKPGGMIDPGLPFSKSIFRNGQSGGALLTIDNNQVITLQDVEFPMNNWGGSFNVAKTVDEGEVTFQDAFGGFAGTPFEKDEFSRIFWGDELMTHSIPLPAGWSGLSSYIMPEDNNIVSIFDPLGSNFIIAQTMSSVYYPAGGLNSIVNWQPQSAYKVKMNTPDLLDISGEEEINKVFGMSTGWSLVPVIANQPVNVASLFAGTSVQLVKDVAGVGVYWPAYSINTLGSLLPGKAYYAYLASSGSVTFPANAKSTWTAQLRQIKHPDHPWNEVAITGSSHLIAVEGNNPQGLFPGDIIGVFAQQQLCFGVAEIIDPKNNFILTAYANDATTVSKDGFDEMELLTYRVYRPSTGETFDVEVEYDLQLPQSGYFTGEGLSAIKLMKLSATGMENNPGAGILIYPNPTDSSVQISGTEEFTQIDVVGTLGAFVQTIQTAGESSVNINLAGLRPGVYQIRLTGEKGTVVKRVVKK